jgi:hypothetical protein
MYFVVCSAAEHTSRGVALDRISTNGSHEITVGLQGNGLGQFVLRNIENAVKARWQRRAKRHGRSMEEEVRDILLFT